MQATFGCMVEMCPLKRLGHGRHWKDGDGAREWGSYDLDFFLLRVDGQSACMIRPSPLASVGWGKVLCVALCIWVLGCLSEEGQASFAIPTLLDNRWRTAEFLLFAPC